MKINVNDTEKMQAALDAVNGRARTHTLRALDIRCAARAAEEDLLERGVTKAAMRGATHWYIPSGPGRSYARKGRSFITNKIRLMRGSRGWFLTACERVEPWADDKGTRCYMLSKEAVDQITRRVLDGITVQREESGQ